MSEQIRLLLIEDHEMVRAGFRMLLNAQPDMHIVGEASSGEQGLELAAKECPDVILLDVSMPGKGGVETARGIKLDCPETAILAVTIHTEQAYLLQMLEAGVDGYLPKRAAADELVNAIRTVHEGNNYVFPGLIDALVDGFRARSDESLEGNKKSILTDRQLQVLRYIADGLTSQRTAERLGLSVRTVERHVENMMRRLDVHSRVELVRVAIREGILEVDD
jgi:two-component system, NarL family, response regulator NreC